MKRHGGVDADDLGAWPRTYHFERVSVRPMDGRDLMISERGRDGGWGQQVIHQECDRCPPSAPSLQSICSGARHLRIVVKWRLLVSARDRSKGPRRAEEERDDYSSFSAGGRERDEVPRE